MKLLIIILLIPIQAQAKVYTKNEWINLYLRDCAPEMYACRQELEMNFGRMLGYQKMVFKYLDKEGLPRWLATVPIVESSYNNKARSPANAIGLWQIMKFNIKAWKTRKIKILGRVVEIVPSDKQVERYGFNPIVSTQLATKHLGRLYKQYAHYENTEELALLAYNAGETKINRWLAGETTLSEETLNYYTKLMAIQYIIKHSKELNINPVKQRRFLAWEYVKSLTRLEDEIEREGVRTIIKRILG
jgi:hypothetical protein